MPLLVDWEFSHAGPDVVGRVASVCDYKYLLTGRLPIALILSTEYSICTRVQVHCTVLVLEYDYCTVGTLVLSTTVL